MEGPWLMEEEISHRLAMPRFSGALVGGMAAGALFLACLGIYATISNLVASRKREIGIRMAVGATAMDVRALVFGHALRLVLIGLTIGLTLAAGATRFLEPYLLGVSRFDETIFAGVSLLILIVSAAATLLPAVRATQIDPNRVLKAN
jgi:ABC-type antimicrobial peptide transport system permease subunit